MFGEAGGDGFIPAGLEKGKTVDKGRIPAIILLYLIIQVNNLIKSG